MVNTPRLRLKQQLSSSSSSSSSSSDAIAQLDPPWLHLSAVAWASAIRRCAQPHVLPQVRILHGLLLSHGHGHGHAHLESLLINAYLKCGSIADALCVFRRMHHPCVFAFNHVIRVCAQQEGEGDSALGLFRRMPESAVLPNQVTYTTVLCVLSSSSKSGDGVRGGKRLHASIMWASCKDDVIVGTSLVSMYGKCGSIHDAERAFDAMADPNLVTWTAMISLYTHHGERSRALQAFTQISLQGFLPNRVSFLSVLSACKDLACLADGRRVHAVAVCDRIEADISLMNALLSMYGRCGSLEETRRFFDAMGEYDIISYSGMIGFYSQQCKIKEVVELLDGMRKNGIEPNDVTFINTLGGFSGREMLDDGRLAHGKALEHGYEAHSSVVNAIIAMYGRCRSLEDAHKVFEQARVKDVALWNSLIGAYAEQGQLDMALRLFQEMQGKVRGSPDIFTFVSLCKACASSQDLRSAMLLHACICEDGSEHPLDIGASLVNTYSKCDDLEDAQKVFDSVPFQNRILWNSIIGANIYHGKPEAAHRLFDKMMNEGRITPDKVTIVSILGACVRSKALVKGKELHSFLLDQGYSIDEAIGSSLISMYGRCGDVDSARHVFEGMREGANLVSWTCMMREYVEQDQGEKALGLYGRMMEEKPDVMPDVACFITVLAACAGQSSLEDGELVHAFVLESGCDGAVDVGNAVVNMYGKCGCAKSAWIAFKDASIEHDVCSWNSLLAAYAQHGLGEEVLRLVDAMEAERHVRPDRVTLSTVLAACSHAGLVHEGYRFFTSAVLGGRHDGYSHPCEDHFVCMIDLLGRAGLVDVAGHFVIRHLPFQPTALAYTTLLGACQLSDADAVEEEGLLCLAKCIVELNPETSASYVLLSNAYSLMKSKILWEQ